MAEDPRSTHILWIGAHRPQAHACSAVLQSGLATNFRITQVPYLKDALNQLEFALFDAIVSELELPDSQGLNTLAFLQNHAPHQPILLLSETEDETLELQALRLGAQACLPKSVLTAELFARTVRRALARKANEESVRASQHQPLQIIHDAPFCVAMFDAEMRYIAFSRRWSEYYGGGRDVIGKSHYEVFPDIPEQWKAYHRRGLNGEFVSKEEDHWVKPDGSEQWLRWAIHPWRNLSGAIGGIIITVEDVTARVLAEQSLRFHENLLQETGHIAKVGGWEFDVATGRGFWTREVALIHELDPGMQPSREMGLNFYVPESRKRLEHALQLAVERGLPYDLELEIITAHGNRRWVRTIANPVVENGGVVRVRGSFQDITERRAVEETLRRQASLLDQVSDAILVWERDGCITYWNRGAERLYGFSSQEAIGKRSDELLKTSFPEDAAATLNQLSERRAWEGELQHVRKDGKRILVESRLVQIIQDSRAYILQTNRDVSEKRLLEEELRQSQKMEAIGRLAGGIAHDFNNLLGVIIGCTELLADSRDPAEVRRLGEDIQKSAQRAANLTRQLLSYSRKQILRPQILDPREKLMEMSDMLRRLVGEDVEIQISLSSERGNLRIDVTQFEQIVLNLIVNAREAMPRGGTIRIETQNVEFGEALPPSHLSVPPGRYLMVAVSDTGHGMDKETCERIFEPFFTTKAGGTGLGLATVYGAVKQSGGSI